MDYTDQEKLKAIIATAKARLLAEQAKSFWMKLKENDAGTTETNFELKVQRAMTKIRDGFDT